MTQVDAENIALSFSKLGISSLFPPEPILSNVSGYVVKGGITAGKPLCICSTLLFANIDVI
jgi:hypothetical protein